MAAETWDQWLARIVREDDPANGGQGILTIGDCPKCEGLGIVERVGKWYDPAPRLAPCAECGGTGAVPAANPEQDQDNGYAPCPECSPEVAS